MQIRTVAPEAIHWELQRPGRGISCGERNCHENTGHEHQTHTLLLADSATAHIVARSALDFEPRALAYGGTGATIALYGNPPGVPLGIGHPGTPRVLLLSAANLDVQWEAQLPDIVDGQWCQDRCDAGHDEQQMVEWTPGVAFSQDNSRLYIVHADADRITAVDLIAHGVHTLDVHPVQSWLDQLLALGSSLAEAKGEVAGVHKDAVLAPDGRRLYVVERSVADSSVGPATSPTPEATSLGLQVVDVDSGGEFDRAASPAYSVRLTADGATLLLEGYDERGPWTELLDAHDLHRFARLENWRVEVTRQVDSAPLFLASQYEGSATRLAVLDARKFTPGPTWQVPDFAEWLAPSYLLAGSLVGAD